MDGQAGRLEAALREAAGWHAAESVDALARSVCGSLAALIPADGFGWNEVDLAVSAVRVVVFPDDYFAGARMDVLDQLIHENPIVRHVSQTGNSGSLAFSDLVSARDYHRLELYADFYGPLGVEDQLATIVDVGEGSIVGIALNRPRRSFTAGDRQLLELLRPHIAAAYRATLDRTEARSRLSALERGLDAAGVALVSLATDGTPTPLSPSAHRLVREWFGDRPPAPGRYERDSATLVVRRADLDPPLLLLEQRRLDVDPERARRLGLTRRQSEILSLAARGLTNNDIAHQLYLSERTIQKHLQLAYERLGVRNRVEAVRRALG